MKTKKSTSAVLKQKARYLLPLTVLCLFSLAWVSQGAIQHNRVRRVTGLLVGQASEGSRVTVIADSTVDDYEAFRRGDRFYVRIPSTEFVGMTPSFHGDGFEDVQVQKVGDSIVISFKLQPGASARVNGGSNRLEVVFFSPTRMVRINNADANAVRSRVTHNSGTSATGARSKRGADVAGPMPPDSPTSYTARNAQGSNPEPISGTPSGVRALNRRETTSTDNTPPSGSPNQFVNSNANSQYSANYPPLSPASTPTVQTPTPTVAAPVWGNRVQVVRQWVAVNRLKVMGGVALLALLGFTVFVLYKRRTRRDARPNTPRVQPKYSPNVELEEMLASQAPDVANKVAPGPYVDEDAYEHWDDSIIVSETMVERPGDVIYKSASDDASSIKNEEWEFVEATPNPQIYQGRVQEEREVFEL